MSERKMEFRGLDAKGRMIFVDPPVMTTTIGPTIGRVWLAECQRCSNVEYSVEAAPAAARAELAEMGWDRDCCPACNGVGQ